MRILFVQDEPGTRCVKQCRALRKRGHTVSLAYSRAPLSRAMQLPDSVFNENFKIDSPRQLCELAQNYQLLHCHNHPDYWTCLAQAGPRPVIHDTHDLVSAADPENTAALFWEARANRYSQGRVYVSDRMYEVAREKYDVDPGTSVVLPNYPNAEALPSARKARLSSLDGQTHIVYEGRVSDRVSESTYLLPLFRTLTQGGLHVHVHPLFHVELYEKAARQEPRLHYYLPLPPEDLLTELTRYDFGLVPPYLNGQQNQGHLDMALPNKLLEYLAADIPVLAPGHRTMKAFLERQQTGVIYQDPAGIPRLIDGYRHRRATVSTMEQQIHLLEDLYLRVMASQDQTRLPTRFSRQ